MKIGFIDIKIDKNRIPTLKNFVYILLGLLMIAITFISLTILGFIFLLFSGFALDFTTNVFHKTVITEPFKYILFALLVNIIASVIYYKIGGMTVNFIINIKNLINDLFEK